MGATYEIIETVDLYDLSLDPRQRVGQWDRDGFTVAFQVVRGEVFVPAQDGDTARVVRVVFGPAPFVRGLAGLTCDVVVRVSQWQAPAPGAREARNEAQRENRRRFFCHVAAAQLLRELGAVER